MLDSNPIRALTAGPDHHFFGYYGICPWSRSEEHMVCLESAFHDHLPSPEEAAAIVRVDPVTGACDRLAQTRAWNLQQGAMLHWHPLNPDQEILYNDRQDGEIIAAILDITTGRKRLLPRAISAVGHRGHYALSLTYGRLTRLRPVVGYVGAVDPNPELLHPENDGVFLMDLTTGESRLVVSIAAVYERLVRDHPELKERAMWFNHTVFNKSDTRFFFLARSWTPEGRLESAMFTAARDGSDLREAIPYGSGVSHFEWRNDRQILATFRRRGSEMEHVLFTDGEQDYQSIGEGFLIGDGHCSFAPDEHRIVTDHGHPDTLEKGLMVYDLETGQGRVLASFPMKEKRFFTGDLRCDLHPRWSRTGDTLCVDALEPQGWTRQLHLVRLR